MKKMKGSISTDQCGMVGDASGANGILESKMNNQKVNTSFAREVRDPMTRTKNRITKLKTMVQTMSTKISPFKILIKIVLEEYGFQKVIIDEQNDKTNNLIFDLITLCF